jgi:hypothetical protein
VYRQRMDNKAYGHEEAVSRFGLPRRARQTQWEINQQASPAAHVAGRIGGALARGYDWP